MNWRCAIGLHDWEYSKEELRTETMDRQHKVHQVAIKDAGRGGTRICRRCDKRQAFEGSWGETWWKTLPRHEDVLARYPKERVEIHE